MKTIHILALGIMALALALASGSAEAELVLKVEDPALIDGELQFRDNVIGEDFNPVVGIITAAIHEDGVDAVINAISADEKTAPRLVLDIETFESPSYFVAISVTDTDFEIFAETPGTATVSGLQELGNVASFTFSGDSANHPFEPGFTIATGSVSEQEISAAQDVSVDPVGSLTLSGVFEKGERVDDLLEMNFTMILTVGKSAKINCPPSILGQTVSNLGKVETGCVIQDSIIEDGDVEVRDVSGFSIVNTKVRNGNIDIENVSGLVTVDRNQVTNGNIEIKETDTPKITRNIVNGGMTINDNTNPRVARNVVSNGDMIVRENTGRTAVIQNIGLGTANLEVDKNTRAVVRDNTTNRDISCKENTILSASGNAADRKVECPEEEDGGLFD